MCCPCRRREMPMKMPTTEAAAVPAPGRARVSRSSREHLRLRAAGRRALGYLRLRLRYEHLRAAGRRALGYLRLRLRYERLRAAGRRALGYLRLRLRYEHLRAAGRRSWLLAALAGAAVMSVPVWAQTAGAFPVLVWNGPAGGRHSLPQHTPPFFPPADVPAGGAADDDRLYAHRDRAVAAAPGAGHAVRAAEPDHHRPVAVADFLRDGPHVRARVPGSVPALHQRQHQLRTGIGQGRSADAQLHAQADPAIGLRPVCPAGPARPAGERANGAAARAGAGFRDQRAQVGVSDRLHDLHPVPGDRHAGLQHPDVPGHDDAVAGLGGAAVQTDAVRARRWLEFAARLAGGQFRDLKGDAMTAQMVLTIGRDALSLLLMISMPVLAAVLAVGLIVSIFQAVTQIHEATLAFVPKLIAAMAVLALAGPWMLGLLVDFIRRTIESIPSMIG